MTTPPPAPRRVDPDAQSEEEQRRRALERMTLSDPIVPDRLPDAMQPPVGD